MHFFTFTDVLQTCFAYNFCVCIFYQLFQRIRNQREILRFNIFYKKKNLRHITTFWKLWIQTRKNGSKNQKTYLVNVS
jgi:hypothetical protein